MAKGIGGHNPVFGCLVHGFGIKKLISNQESIAPTSTSTVVATPVAMPRVVNVDGIMSVDENGNTYNNTNDPEEKCDD